MLNLWLSYFLLVAILGPSEVMSGGEIWSSMRFPNEELGPDNWRYYRVELPPVFSLLTISLARDEKKAGNGSAATGPLVCFGFNGPPLPVEPRKSLLEAAINAGASQNASATGECAWFSDTVEVNVTNLEVRSGILHVGIFSNSMPTRTQSKMIPRGKKYEFGIGIQVFWCGTGALGGPECNLGIGSLPPGPSLKSLHSMNTPLHDDRSFLLSRSSKNQLDKKLVAQLNDEPSPKYSTRTQSESSSDHRDRSSQSQGHKDEDTVHLRNKKQDDFGTTAEKLGWSDWISSSQKCVGLDENQFFCLQIEDFFQELEIKYDCIPNASHGISKCEEFETMVKESRIPLLHLRHGALPGMEMSDFLGEPSTGSITISEPKRGWWFLAIFDPTTVTSKHEGGRNSLAAGDDMCLELKWRARTCGPGLTGDDCQWPVLHLERILEEEFESPFDSYYHPASDPESLDHDSEWFSLESFSNESRSDLSVEQWAFAMFRIADGAAGAFLSADVKTSLPVNTELYARYEGCPSSSIWDLKATKGDSQRLTRVGGALEGVQLDRGGSQMLVASKYQTLSLPVVYPMEGYWCIGLKYTVRETNEHTMILDNSSSKGEGTMGERGEGDGVLVHHGNLSSGIGKEVELRVMLHGCPNKCSGHGSCQTVYEASRLHLISYCRCDVIHGGFDCSTVVLGLWNDLRQRFLLIFSNAAAILPSAWALRNKAYSEWVTFTLSGIASAIYHSCDAGGWCAMSYSTLQFLDFWLSFVVIIMTCLLMAGFHGQTKAMLHVGCAILTAAVAKEDATSGWSVLVVVLISSTGLLLGWGLETQKLSSLRLRWTASTTGASRGTWLQMGQRLARSFVMQLRDRFYWRYLFVGLALLLSALVSNLMEQPETYWIFHSWWHICIYTSAFILLYSIRNIDGAFSRRLDDLEGYHHISMAQGQDEDSLTDSHEALVSELDSFPESHVH